MKVKDVKLAVIINSYNRLVLLKEALSSLYSLLKVSLTPSTIILVDAGSDDGSVEFLQDFITQHVDLPLHLLQKPNLTFSQGCNVGALYAINIYPALKYVMLYETDNFLKNPAAIDSAIELLEIKEEISAVGFTVEKHNGEKVGYGERFPSPLSFVLGQQLSFNLALNDIKIKTYSKFNNLTWFYGEIIFTSPLILKKKVWKELGGMDEASFPFCDSDSDLCWQLAKTGLFAAVLDIPGVIHDNKSIQSSWSERRVMDYHRARFTLLRKHRGKQMYFYIPLFAVRHLAELFILILRMKSIKRIKVRLKLFLSSLAAYKNLKSIHA